MLTNIFTTLLNQREWAKKNFFLFVTKNRAEWKRVQRTVHDKNKKENWIIIVISKFRLFVANFSFSNILIIVIIIHVWMCVHVSKNKKKDKRLKSKNMISSLMCVHIFFLVFLLLLLLIIIPLHMHAFRPLISNKEKEHKNKKTNTS